MTVRACALSAFAILALSPGPAEATPLCASALGGLSDCSGAGFAASPDDLIVDGVSYRTYDGVGNNAGNALWGSTGSEFLRATDPDYDANSFARSGGPDARDVSTGMTAGGGSQPNGQGLSSMFWAWGQFVDHDVTLTAESHDATMPLGGDMGDVSRSASVGGQQINNATAYLDASMVYGADEATAKTLRANDGTGRMLLDADGNLPTDANGNFLAGDPRANEQQQLISMHTVFAREHNRIADTLTDANPDWSGEKVYQESRALVGGQIQAITYNDWLPSLVGEKAMGGYDGYDSRVDATLTNEFSTCAFRFCHSMIPDELERLAENGDPIAEGHLALKDGFFDPDEWRDSGGADALLRGLASQKAMEVDQLFSDELRNFLDAGDGENSDLFARNIQRGRDHGLADYNLMRAAYGLPPVNSWDELTDDPAVLAELKALYGATPEGLDPYLGSLLESARDGALVGDLNWSILTDQFTRLRDGDRFWYENLFSTDVIAWLDKRSLSDIILDNTGIAWMQENVFAAVTRGVAAPGGLALLLVGVLAMRRRRLSSAATGRSG